MAIGTVAIGLITFLMTICGMAALVNFKNCDPLKNPNDQITRAEQIVPYLIQASVAIFKILALYSRTSHQFLSIINQT